MYECDSNTIMKGGLKMFKLIIKKCLTLLKLIVLGILKFIKFICRRYRIPPHRLMDNVWTSSHTEAQIAMQKFIPTKDPIAAEKRSYKHLMNHYKLFKDDTDLSDD